MKKGKITVVIIAMISLFTQSRLEQLSILACFSITFTYNNIIVKVKKTKVL